MNESEAVEKLNALTGKDPEREHGEAEEIVLALLRRKGFGAVAKAFDDAGDRVGFWYA